MQESGISKQKISDIWKNKDKILKFTDGMETSEGLKRKSLNLADDEQLDKALYAWFIQQSVCVGWNHRTILTLCS